MTMYLQLDYFLICETFLYKFQLFRKLGREIIKCIDIHHLFILFWSCNSTNCYYIQLYENNANNAKGKYMEMR